MARAVPAVLGATGIAAVLVIWWLATASGLVPAEVLPSPASTLGAAHVLLGEGEFWAATGATLTSWAVGLGVSAAVAVPLGVLLGRSDTAYRLVRVPVEAMRPVPPVVLLPLALLILGGGLTFKVALIAQGAVWPLMVQTMYGVRATDPLTLDTARSLKLGRVRTLGLVHLPSAAPTIAPALRLAAATAFAVSLVSELVGGATGLGNLLVLAVSGNALPRVYAITLVVGVVGLGIAALFGAAERPILRWAPGRRS